MRSYWDEGLRFFSKEFEEAGGGYVCAEPSPSAEDEYFASLEPEREPYELDLILVRSRLTQKQLFAIECHYGFRGPEMSQEQIARLMGVSQQAVSRLIERGLANLRRGVVAKCISRPLERYRSDI